MLEHNSNNILVVDDDSDVVTLIQMALNRHGFKVSTFRHPLRALEDFKTNPKGFSLILSDIRMPGMNGYEFVKQLKKINPQVKVILMSAFEINDKEFHNLLPDIKIDGFLKKPFSIQALYDVIHKIGA